MVSHIFRLAVGRSHFAFKLRFFSKPDTVTSALFFHLILIFHPQNSGLTLFYSLFNPIHLAANKFFRSVLSAELGSFPHCAALFLASLSTSLQLFLEMPRSWAQPLSATRLLLAITISAAAHRTTTFRVTKRRTTWIAAYQ